MSQHTDKELDVSNSGRGIWLVKVPKYIANKWEKAPSSIEVGKLKINRNASQKVQVSLSLSESMLCVDTDNQEAVPRNYRLDVTPVTSQMLGVFSQGSGSHKLDDSMLEPDKLVLEGKIVQRLECRPYADDDYMKLKLERFRKAHQPVRLVKRLDRAVNVYKPVSTHKHLLLDSKKYRLKTMFPNSFILDDSTPIISQMTSLDYNFFKNIW